MEPTKKFDVASLSNIVQRKQEKLASGVEADYSTPQHFDKAAHTSQDDYPVHQHSRQDRESMAGDFLGMLLQQSGSVQSEPINFDSESSKFSTKTGTTEFFSPPNKCRDRKEIALSENGEFSFSLVNSKLGELDISGVKSESGLLVNIKVKNPKFGTRTDSIAKILTLQLSKQFGLNVEVKID